MSKVLRLSFIIMLLMMFFVPTGKAQKPVVYGVFFFSPTCPHCHKVMTQDWPGIEARFGNQLKVLFVDVTTADGRDLMLKAMQSVPLESGGVPQLIIGTDVLVGDVDIPAYASSLIEQGLAAGGVGYPNIPNIESWFAKAGLGEYSLEISPFSDPANLVAMGVLTISILSLLLIGFAAWQLIGQNNPQLLMSLNPQIGWWLFLLTTLTGFGLALTLLFGSHEAVVMGLASLIALIFIASTAILGNHSSLSKVPNWLVPLIMLAGIISAAYLSYVEFTLSDAVCGAMGDCNTVQQSAYAHIGGIPVGFIGIAAYVTMLLIWLLGRGDYKQFADNVLMGFTFFGVIFSAYLTFLEPFVIGASCVWCLISTVTMLSLLWLIAPNVLESFAPKSKRPAPYDEVQATA